MYPLKTILLFTLLMHALFANDIPIKSIFEAKDLNGTLLISSLHDKEYSYNMPRAEKRFTPASTFKIAHTLIALEEQVVTQDENIKWDEKIRTYEAWNKDQTLQSAIAVSCVWCYQQFANVITNDTYLNYLKQMNYGNGKTGLEKSTFWLNSELKISAREQVEFLKKLYRNELPFHQKHLDFTKEILVIEKNKNYTMRVKTGFSNGLGWYIGYVETKEDVWFFALNMDINNTQLSYRKEVLFEALKVLYIL
ncbi:MAG: Beta-lactamase (EC [uncultured Sulfurovum sp.]|uniref:Beta-lactamase n=1 Tax=uncultured Sulfurovum sp. TaxID=269237 RepID=A0A6S6S2S9_9BACT|nr:MAG: Beta-lactamase (EC [uncultured Sulfurovum sp.]